MLYRGTRRQYKLARPPPFCIRARVRAAFYSSFSYTRARGPLPSPGPSDLSSLAKHGAVVEQIRRVPPACYVRARNIITAVIVPLPLNPHPLYNSITIPPWPSPPSPSIHLPVSVLDRESVLWEKKKKVQV